MQTSFRYLSGAVCGLVLFLGSAPCFAQHEIALDTRAKSPGTPEVSGPRRPDAPHSDTERINALEETLRQQGAQLEEVRKLLSEQQDTIKLLTKRLTGDTTTASTGSDLAAVNANAAPSGTALAVDTQTPTIEDRLKKVEGRVSEIGAIKFSGDIRLRSESFFGLANSLASGSTPGAFGNDLSSRHRMRLRARLSMRGSIGDEFDWGLRLATGGLADNISTNQTLTDFFNRKPFSLDQAFVTYKPKAAPGLRLQGGKFEPPWIFTELTFDNDIMVEGINESYTHTFKGSALKELALVAWQLPFLERNSAFVRNSNGTINISESRRGGRDLALYGAQLRARLEPSANVGLSLSVADHYYSGTQFISPLQVFGSQLQLPITIVIPATATTPAQIVTTQVLVPRDLLVAGNGNLGLTNASNNATNRDGRLASGFNLVDVLGRLDLKYSKRWPIAISGNFVLNTQTHGVVTPGPGGADVILPNHENKGFWGEIQVGGTKARGDAQFGYTFLRIQKDAVLTPFNWSDITQQSDVRGHRFNFSYAVDPRVTFTATAIVTERLHGLFGPFVATPVGSSNHATTRFQFDTIIRF